MCTLGRARYSWQKWPLLACQAHQRVSSNTAAFGAKRDWTLSCLSAERSSGGSGHISTKSGAPWEFWREQWPAYLGRRDAEQAGAAASDDICLLRTELVGEGVKNEPIRPWDQDAP